MLVSLSSYCQYPTVKTIGKDTVVIMTVKQGQDINQKFMDLTAEIEFLKDSVAKKTIEIKTLYTEKKNLNNSLSSITIKSQGFEEENIRLKKLIEQNDNEHLIERRKWAGWMFFSFVMTVMLGALK